MSERQVQCSFRRPDTAVFNEQIHAINVFNRLMGEVIHEYYTIKSCIFVLNPGNYMFGVTKYGNTKNILLSSVSSFLYVPSGSHSRL